MSVVGDEALALGWLGLDPLLIAVALDLPMIPRRGVSGESK
jgi:hypothetical protein